jgi:hypothetical protein
MRTHDYELWIDINETGGYDIHCEINPQLKGEKLMILNIALQKQSDKIKKIIVGES